MPMAVWARYWTQQFNLRSRNLLRLGYRDYEHYLDSLLWKRIRATQLKRYPKCADCKATAYQVHHTRYDIGVLRGETRKGLLSLCRGCHVLRTGSSMEGRWEPAERVRARRSAVVAKYLTVDGSSCGCGAPAVRWYTRPSGYCIRMCGPCWRNATNSPAA